MALGGRRGWTAWAALLLALVFATGCAARWAHRQGQAEARKGNWDLAVARFTRALQKNPDNIGYKIALENARIQASRQHYELARRHLLAEELEKSAEELQIAVNYDPANKSAADDLAILRQRMQARDDELRRLADFDTLKAQAQGVPPPLPVLSPQSEAPISIKFENTSLQKILETMGRLAGVNVLFDDAYRDKTVSVDLRNESFRDALDRLTFVNRLFYIVLDTGTIIVVPETAAKRRTYDARVLRTFYLENAETKDLETLIKTGIGSQTLTVVSNANLGAITVFGTPDEVAVAERLVTLHDKARGEVVVELEVLEVNRTNMKNYGIELSNYTAAATFAPTGSPGELAGGLTNLRAQLLSSLNVSDFVLSVPSTILTRFLQTDSTVRILANPRLRAAEGKRTSLRIGTEVPIPVTTFTATQAGSTTFAPATSFNYKNVGVNLEITPRVHPNGDISLEMDAEFSILGEDRNVGTGQNPLNVPTFLTRKVTGTLRLRDGERTLLGGLLQGRDSDAFTGILGLQSIPILNKIFTSRDREKEDSEILMSITPHLVRGPKVTAADLESVLIGTRERTRMGTARPTLGLPEDQIAPPVAAPGPDVPPAVTPSPTPTPGTLFPPSPPPGAPPRVPPGAGVGSPAGVGPAVVPPSPSPSPALVPEEPPSATIEPSPSEAADEATGPVRVAVSALTSPSAVSIPVGGTGTIGLVVMGAQDLRVVDLSVVFDPAVLDAQDVAPGPLLTLDGSPVGVNRGLESGRLRAQFTRQAGSAGSGVVATMTFRGLRAGTTTVTVEALILGSGAGTVAMPVSSATRVTVGQ
ncbi:MAG TPA: cohesin domain-containing protein [Vicinamibacteria bacterium]|nr:cohesin domain-containing protein [Vicinamibacteria bacterium]